jgi:hypothetical protein
MAAVLLLFGGAVKAALFFIIKRTLPAVSDMGLGLSYY